MADAAMILSEFGGDLVLSGLDLARDDGLETSVIISLFTESPGVGRANPTGTAAG